MTITLPQEEAFLPQNSSLGVLTLIDVYEYYDQPVLFSCRNQKGIIYLAVWIDEDSESQLWLYAPMSRRRFEQVRSGAIDLRSAFLNAEDNAVFSLRKYKQPDYQSEVLLIGANSLTDNQLPRAGEFLSIPTETLSRPVETIKQRALQTRRELIDLSISLIDRSRSEAPIARLGALMQSLQTLINNIGNKVFGSQAQRGTLPQRIVADMQFNAVGFASGSFVVQMASSAEGNLFDDTLASDALNEFVVLLQLAESENELRARLMDLGARVSSAYVAFLQSVNLEVASINVDWGSPDPNKGGSATISSELARRTVDAIKRFEEQAIRDIPVVCVLIGANIRLMRFEIEVDGSYIAGDVDESARDVVTGAVLGNTYTALLRSIEIFRPMLENASLQYILLGLRDSQPPDVVSNPSPP